jgi:flagellar hook protein FlgE
MLTTFTTGLSGLNANASGLSVVGNNLANLNTTGYKASNISFVDVLGQSLGTATGNTINIGLGAQVGSVRESFTSGAAQTTNNPLDVAIQGKGFLIVNDGVRNLYTRAGNLHIDANNTLVSDAGYTVQGYLADPTTGLPDVNAGLQNIQMPVGLNNPTLTSQFQLAMNLDANAPTGTRFNTSFLVYDSLGDAHTATVNFIKDISAGPTPVTRWRFDVTIPNRDIAGVPTTDTQARSLITGAVAVDPPAEGALQFDSAGNLISAYFGADPATPPALADLTIPSGSVPAMTNGATISTAIDWLLVGSGAGTTVSAYASPSEVTYSSQNGAGAGTLASLMVNPDGMISATFTNGSTVDFAQVVLALFNNNDGLSPMGGGNYMETRESGVAFLGGPGNGGRGQLMAGALEQSNVDLATELTKIITYQRAYQANARIITTTDEIMQEMINIAR